MKIFSILIFLCFSLSALAEKKGSHPVTVQVENQTIRVLFSQIEKQLELKFSYNTSLLNADSVISYSASKPLAKVIHEVFRKKLKSKIIGNYIVLIRKKIEKSKPITLTGFVYNSTTQVPLPYTSIYEVGSKQSTLTNAQGKFEMVFEKGTRFDVSIAKKNYADTLISMIYTPGQNLKIYLQPTLTPLYINSNPLTSATLKDTNQLLEMLVPFEERINSENLNFIHDKSTFQISIIPKVGTNFKSSGVIENRFSLNVLGGYNGGLNGVEVGGLFNILTKNMRGVQLAGLTNQVEGTTYGFQVAGIHNRVEKNVTGLQVAGISNFLQDSILGMQVAGISNIVTGSFEGFQVAGIQNHVNRNFEGLQVAGISNFLHDRILGMQVAGISNIVTGSFEGFQVAGIQNHVNRNFKGFQLAGIMNWAEDSLTGLQLSGIGNITRGSVTGLQLSSIQNLSVGDVNGVQLTGIQNQTFGVLKGVQVSVVNYARVNNGLQIGLINVSDSANGIAIGLFNYVGNGYHPIEIFGNEVLYTNIAYKSGVDDFYSTWTIGLRPSDPKIFGIGFGVGTHINIWKWLSVSADITSTFINEDELDSTYKYEHNLLNRMDVALDFNLGKFTLTMGPGLNIHSSRMGYASEGVFTTNLAVNPFHTEVFENTQVQFWWGAKAGLRYNF